MGMNYGTSIVQGGLVFHYDMHNKAKSWKGMPLTNQFPLPTPSSNGDVTFPTQGSGTFNRVSAGLTYGGYTVQPSDVVYRFDLSAVNNCWYHGGSASISAGVYPTFTFDYYISPDAANLGSSGTLLANFENYGGGAVSGSAALPNVEKGVWQTVTFSGGQTGSSGTQAMFLYPGGCGYYLASSGYILYKNPQVIFSSTSGMVAPFVSGTRSTTEAIKDLTGNNTLTATSLTYNIDGSFSFNGSDYIDISNSALISGTNPFTIESWTNKTSGSYGAILDNYGSGYANGIWWATAGLYIQGSVYHSDYSNSMAGIHHSACTRDSSGNVVLYRDGVQVNTGTLTGSVPTNINWRIGADVNGASEAMNGSIYNIKVYNRVLSASEIRQNFNATRGRYGI